MHEEHHSKVAAMVWRDICEISESPWDFQDQNEKTADAGRTLWLWTKWIRRCLDRCGGPQGEQNQEEGTGETGGKPASERMKTSAVPV